MKIGFIGLGIMGKPMAKNLLKAGYSVTCYDIVAKNVEEVVAAGATRADSCKAAAADCEVVITMLPNSPHVKEAVFGKDGIIEGIRPGAIMVDMSSIAPAASREIAEGIAAKGATMLDAPVSGGEPKAVDGTLAVMVGGDAKAFEKVKDILLKMGSSVVHVGETGSGNVTKLANQIIVAGNIVALSEAMVFAAKAGMDPEKVVNAIKGGLAGSTIMNAKAPMILDGNFAPGFRVELHIKDLDNAIQTARQLDIPIPLTDEAMRVFQELKADGCEKEDHSAMVKVYEKRAKVKARKSN